MSSKIQDDIIAFNEINEITDLKILKEKYDIYKATISKLFNESKGLKEESDRIRNRSIEINNRLNEIDNIVNYHGFSIDPNKTFKNRAGELILNNGKSS